MKIHRKSWLLQNMTSYSWLNVKLDLFFKFFKHSLICYCVGNCNIAHAGWLGADSMKEVDMKQ